MVLNSLSEANGHYLWFQNLDIEFQNLEGLSHLNNYPQDRSFPEGQDHEILDMIENDMHLAPRLEKFLN